MLARMPHVVGRLMRPIRPGLDHALHHEVAPDAPTTLEVTSPAFTAGSAMPVRYTDDGEGVSPPLAWTGVPDDASSLVLVIEDVDSPTPKPLVHSIVLLEGSSLPEGALPGPAGRGSVTTLGLNSYLRRQYMSPDPPPGHGPHRYVFQILAVRSTPLSPPLGGRRALASALRDNVSAKGVLVVEYERT